MDFLEIGKKWQKKREEAGTYKVIEDPEKESFYILDMFPYPSWAGLHVWHPKWYIATDVIARKHMLLGQKVLHPMGFDTFWVGTEQYAIAHKMKPQKAAADNIATYKRQLAMFGCTYDRDREVNTADPNYFKWTQATFLKMYNSYFDEKDQKAYDISVLKDKIHAWEIKIPDTMTKEEFINSQRLCYMDYKPINRCPNCKTWLSNEDLEADGTCERCGSMVEQRPMKQRVIRITKYADRLLKWLDNLPWWADSVKDQQRNRIGRSEWTEFEMRIAENGAENGGEWRGIKKVFNDGTYDIIGCAMNVHKQLWPGLQEKVYHKALLKLLEEKWLDVESEKIVPYKVNNEVFWYWKVDIVVNWNIAIELKSKKNIEWDFYKQLRTYINQSDNTQTWLLINFYNSKLEYKRLEKDYGRVVGNNSENGAENNREWVWEWQRMGLRMTENISQVFSEKNSQIFIKVYTTRVDTVFGMSFVVMAPEHELVDRITTAEYRAAVDAYVDQAKHKTQLERTWLQKEKTWQFTWSYAINPFNGKKIPIYIWDYVLAWYGTWVVMAVPAHDERDFDFAKKYDIEIINSILPEDKDHEDYDKIKNCEICYPDKWILNDSWEFTGLKSDEAIAKMQKWLTERWIGWKKVNYRLQDRVFSRQRYRWEPIPMIHCPNCGIVPLTEDDLPLTLPDVENYEPTGTEEWPLANIHEWMNVKCPHCGADAKRESNTMPWWAGSSRYWIRYMDPHNDKQLVAPEKEKFWHPVNMYVWWAEHINRHMIYARFRNMFLYDMGITSVQEPFESYQSVWLIMAEDGRKMSKRRWNVVNPDDIVNEYWADTLRVYEMFMWPFDQAVSWNTNWVKWVKKFLDRVCNLYPKVDESYEDDKKILMTLHQTIKKVDEDVSRRFGFNTAIAQMMILVNELTWVEKISKKTFETLIILLAPFAPHLAEEFREKLGNQFSIFDGKNRPEVDEKYLIQDTVTMAVQVNGKVRWTIEISKTATQEEVFEIIKNDEKISRNLVSEIKKVIYIPWKICNIVL